MSSQSNAAASSLEGAAPGPSLAGRFLEANKRFCRDRLKPRLYPVSHMTALNCWYERRVKTGGRGSMLEFGCGRDLPLTHLLGNRFSACYATDVEDLPAGSLPAGVTFRMCSANGIPFDDGLFDVVLIRSVIEHIDDPDRTFAELFRVTKPGGRVLMNLPNKWDYVSVIARLTGSAKSRILKSVVRTTFEDFPVLYRCNTRGAISKVARGAGFEVVELMPLPSQPSYLSFFVPLYVLGVLYQTALGLLGLDALQPAFVVLLRKPAAPEPASRAADPTARGSAV